MKKLLTLLSLLVVAVSTFGQQKFNVGGLEYTVLSIEDKTVQLTSGVGAKGDVVVPTAVTVPASQVLDIQWTTQSGPDWTNSEDENGNTVYKSGIIGDNESTVLRCTFRVSGTIAFMCRYQGEYTCDYLTIGDCDVPCTRDFYSTSLAVTPGIWRQIVISPSDEDEHYIEFCYSKDGGTTNDPDCAEVYLTVFEGGECSVASISEDCTFQGNTNITSISFPESFTEFTTIRDYMFFGCTALKSFSIPNATTIGSCAFYGCESLEEAIMPKVETIGWDAFSGTALTSVNLPVATTIGSCAFQGCESLEEAIMPKVETIGSFAFGRLDYYDENGNYWVPRYCKSLARVDLSSVKSIEDNAFPECTNINSLRIGSVDQWCQVNFGDSYANPLQSTSQTVELYVGDSEIPAKNLVASNTLTEIPNYAFYRLSNIESISAPAATTIGSYAFCGTALTSVNLPAATTIGSYAFCGAALTSVNLPAATTIGSYAFHGCESLEEAIMPKVETIGWNAFSESGITSVNLPVATAIGGNAFQGCESLEEAIMPKVETIGFHAFGCMDNYDENGNWVPRDCKSLARVDLSSVKSIEDNAFQGCESLEKAIMPKVETIGQYAFSESGITSVNLPAATTIESYAFQGCESLEEAIIPSVETIGCGAFSCASLKHVDLASVKTIGENAFNCCQQLSHLELPEVREIGNSAFWSSSLKYLSIPKVENIGRYTFSNINIDSLRIGSIEQYCNIKYQVEGMDEWAYESKFPFGNVDYYNDKNFLFIGDSETPATEITIPESVEQVPDFAFLGTGIHTIHFEGTTPPSLVSTKSFSEWTMLAVPEEAYETYLAADVYNTIPLQITKDGHLTQELELEAKSTTSALLAKVGDQEIRNVVNLKLKGTINSYDMLIIRNRMTSLRNLDLSEASIVDCDFAYSTSGSNSYHSIKDEITGDWLMGLMNVKLPANTKAIGDGAFRGCSRLVSVNIPDGVESIDNCAFYGCNRIKELTLPQSVTSVGPHAFDDCTGLKEVVIPDGVTSINSYAFYGCRDLEKVTIPASVKNIGYYAFMDLGNSISLRISDINSWMDAEIAEYWSNSGAFSNVGTLFIGDSDEPVEDIIIPAGTTELKRNTFAGFSCLKSVTLPDELKTIGSGTFSGTGLTEVKMPRNLNYIGSCAFSDCTNLESVEFTDSLKTIEEFAFGGCNLKKIELPSYLQTIGRYAFGSRSLTDILIPASIKEIGDYAFLECNNLNTVIATTVEPITINQNTFSTYRTANVYSPKTSYWKYYWNTQWNQFLSVNEYGKKFGKHYGYKYFYLRGHHGGKKEDFEIDDETGVIHGSIDPEFSLREEAPDADFGEESGIIVGGSQVQELGDIHIHHNGNNGASVIAKNSGKVHIDNLYVDIKTQKNRWYFFCFPFDINPGEATFGGSHVWYLYDGEARALNGNGGWKKVANDGVMKSGNGYIFQGAVNGTLTIHVQDITIDTNDNSTNMITYQSDNKNDASWNLIGNSNFAYYDIDNLGYDAPITVYNNETGNYEAVRAGEDDCELYPFQAFFVQKPEGTESMDFANSKKETKNKSDEKKAKKAAARAKAPKKVDAMRQVINLEIAAVDMEADSIAAPADRTRVVVNPTKSTGYETDCDAAKFIADNIAQIYSLDTDGCKYAINERPVGNGVIDLAVKAPKDGFFTISAPRLDCDARLRDLETGSEVDLAKGGYTFAAEATTYTKRFQLVLGGEASGIKTLEDTTSAIDVENGAISVNDANANVKVYSVGGALVATHKGTGRINVAAGAYVVVVNGQSVKVTVNE